MKFADRVMVLSCGACTVHPVRENTKLLSRVFKTRRQIHFSMVKCSFTKIKGFFQFSFISRQETKKSDESLKERAHKKGTVSLGEAMSCNMFGLHHTDKSYSQNGVAAEQFRVVVEKMHECRSDRNKV